MSKNKFIRALKIMCVLAPIVLPLLVGTISYFTSAISISGVTFSEISHPLDFAEDLYTTGTQLIVSPLAFNIYNMRYSTFGAPIYNMAEWTTTNFFGVNMDGLLEASFSSDVATVFPLYLILIIFWYIMVELVFFIPEVILLFIRWGKNLIYSFTHKGGFDA